MTITEHFEGPEKNLEIAFILSPSCPRGCRDLSRDQIDTILNAAKCQILSHVSNEHLDAYVLSESSLFIYPEKILIKTCGTTTLLRALPLILEYTSTDLEMELEWLSYSRKNFVQPQHQIYPHTSFDSEIRFLESVVPNADFGSAHVIGPVTSDHWLIYVYDNCEKEMDEAQERTIHILMQDLDENVSSIFFNHTSKEMTSKSGIDQLIPTGQIDDWAFNPCGYSMNAIDASDYHTIHITPESHCSYASWETNAKPASYSKLIQTVVNIFQPARFTITLFADKASMKDLQHDPFEDQMIEIPSGMCYKRKSRGHTYFEGDYLCFVANWVALKS